MANLLSGGVEFTMRHIGRIMALEPIFDGQMYWPAVYIVRVWGHYRVYKRWGGKRISKRFMRFSSAFQWAMEV